MAAGPTRWAHLGKLLGAALCAALAACGGGGGGGGGTSGKSAVASYPASAAALTDSNVAAIAVRSGPGNNVNIPYVSVRVCVPGTRTCTTIDNVLLDTGSTGLRLFASQVNPAIALPAQTVGSSSTISECAQFLNTLAWGSVKLADVELGGEHAPSVPIQLMDANFAPVPPACGSNPLLTSSTDPIVTPANSNTQALTANGILGTGLFTNDGQIYFNCTPPTDSCELPRLSARYPSPAQQVQNPVSLFTSGNNNGVIIHLPALPASGAVKAEGYLIFGVGTQTNNRLGSAYVVPVSPYGFFTTHYRGASYPASFIDSGSNGLYFEDPGPSVLAGTCARASNDFYCPSSTQNLSASIQLASGSVNVDFSVASADYLFTQNGEYAFNNLGGHLVGTYFDWGLPFFFGKSVYTVIEGRTVNTDTGSLSGPFNAFHID